MMGRCGACSARRRAAMAALREKRLLGAAAHILKGARQMVTGATEQDRKELGVDSESDSLNAHRP